MTVPQSESSGFFIVRLRGIGKTCGADSNRVPAPTRKTPMIEGVRMARAGPASLFAPHPRCRAERARFAGDALRRAPPRAEQLREPRVPGGPRGGRTGPRGREVLPPRALERGADPRGAR